MKAVPGSSHKKKVSRQDFDGLVSAAATLDRLADGSSFNLFRVLKIAQLEIRHSMVLAWLLNPAESHGLGSRFLADMLGVLGLIKAQRTQFLKKVSIRRELDHMDVVLVSDDPKIIIVIENKLKASEGEKQLKRYHDHIERNYREYERFYVFLTPEGRFPQSEDMCQTWLRCSYREVYQILQKRCDEVYGGTRHRGDAEVLLRNYLMVLKEDVLKMPDNGERKRYEAFYKKHKAALDRLFEVVHPGVSAEIWNALRSFASNKKFQRLGFLLPPECRRGNVPTFCVKAVDDYLGEVEKGQGSWGDGRTYICELKVDYDNERICCNFVLGGVNCPPDLVGKFQRISNFPKGFKPWMTRDESDRLAKKGKRGVRFHFCKWYGKRRLWEDYGEQGIPEATKNVVLYFLEWVKKESPNWKGRHG